jgi:hypothetical protein
MGLEVTTSSCLFRSGILLSTMFTVHPGGAALVLRARQSLSHHDEHTILVNAACKPTCNSKITTKSESTTTSNKNRKM